MLTLPLIISVDDHVMEPPNLWQDRLPRKYLDVGPRVERAGVSEPQYLNSEPTLEPQADGRQCDWWCYEDLRKPLTRPFAAVGVPRDQRDAYGITYDDMRPGCYDPVERLKDMDLNGVEASLCFPNVLPRFCGQQFLWAKDRDLSLLCIQAYNDWMVEEWAGPSGGRLIPLCMIPLFDSQLAAEEIYRNAARGVHAVTFSELPARLGLPSIHDRGGYWEPFIRACAETRTTICLHVGSSSQLPSTSSDCPYAISSVLLSTNAMASLADWLFSGWFERFPDLKIAFSEANIGWIPYALERSDRVWAETRWSYDNTLVPRPPSEYFADHVFGCYIADDFGVQSLSAIGIDNVTFETDYPHTDSSWPNSADVARQELVALSDEDVRKVLRGNAIRMLSLDLAP